MTESNFIATDLKIIVIGKSGAGKTSYVNKWIRNKFLEFYMPTIICDYSYKIVDYEG